MSIVNKKIFIDMSEKQNPPVVYAVQGDTLSRTISANLMAGGIPWSPDASDFLSIAFKKPDGTSGWYDKLPDGGDAISASANEIAFMLAPQVLTVAGDVSVAIIAQSASLHQIATFPFIVKVSDNPAFGGAESNDYYNYKTIGEINTAIKQILNDLTRIDGQNENINREIENINEKIENIHDPIIVESRGKTINILDASERHFLGFSLFGKTTQITTTGKNIADVRMFSAGPLKTPTASSEKSNSYGTALSATSGKSVVVTQSKYPNTTDLTHYNNGFFYIGFYCPLKVGDRITISFDYKITANPLKTSIFLIFLNTGINVLAKKSSQDGRYYYSYAIDSSYASAQDGWNYFEFRNAGTSGVFSNFQVEISSSYTGYEPYTGGKPSPSPDYPQELVIVGNGGAIKTLIAGKNLINREEVTFTKGHIVNLDVPLQPGEYTVSAVITSDDTDDTLNYVVFLGGGGDGSNVYAALNRNTRNSYTVTIYKPVSQIALSASSTVENSEGDTATYKQVQIENGDTATEYEPYKGQTLTAKTPNGLPGIPVASGGNYTDSDGQRWICDKIDFGSDKYINRVVKRTFDASDTFGSTDYNFSYANAKFTTKPKANTSVMCSHAIGVTINAAGNLLIPRAQFANIGITDAAAFAVWVAEQSATQNPFTVWYEMETPTETNLSGEELAAYATLNAYKDYTTVFNDSGAEMEVKYVADTKSYIDNKFTELQNAILANGANL